LPATPGTFRRFSRHKLSRHYFPAAFFLPLLSRCFLPADVFHHPFPPLFPAEELASRQGNSYK
jgi:hypothetical protein